MISCTTSCKQTGEDDFLAHPRPQRLGGALQAVIRRAVEPHREEVDEPRCARHRIEPLHVAGASDEQVSDAAPRRARLDLCLKLRHRRERLGGRGLLHGDGLVQPRAHELLERVGLGLVAQEPDRRRPTQGRDERSAIDLHESLLVVSAYRRRTASVRGPV